MAVSYKIHGDDMQAIEIVLKPKEQVRSEAGMMLYKQVGIEMETKAEGGILKGLKRMITGESFFIPRFTNVIDQEQKVAFAAPYPGKIIPVNLKEFKGELLCQRDSFLCAEVSVDIEIAFTKRLGAGFFGGEGFILEKLAGEGLAFIHAGGTVMKHELKEGEVLEVDTGCLVAFSSTVDYNITTVKGIVNALFGGEGIFLAHLTGPGVVYLQSLPFSRMADRILSMYKSGSGVIRTKGGEGSIVGGILGKVISGD